MINLKIKFVEDWFMLEMISQIVRCFYLWITKSNTQGTFWSVHSSSLRSVLSLNNFFFYLLDRILEDNLKWIICIFQFFTLNLLFPKVSIKIMDIQAIFSFDIISLLNMLNVVFEFFHSIFKIMLIISLRRTLTSICLPFVHTSLSIRSISLAFLVELSTFSEFIQLFFKFISSSLQI